MQAASLTRKIAVKILTEVMTKKRFVESCLATYTPYLQLDTRDKAFVANIVYTTLRHMGRIDHVINRCLSQKRKQRPIAQNLLRTAAAQIMCMEVETYAVVNSSVNVAKSLEVDEKFVNAVLRRIAEKHKSILSAKTVDVVSLDVPKWLRGSLKKSYGEVKANEVSQILLTPAPLDIVVKADAGKWADRLGGKRLSDVSVRLQNRADIASLDGFATGEWWVQDYCSALAVEALGDVSEKKVLDACASPGGKTMQLAAKLANVTAMDISGARLGMLAENLTRVGLQAKVECGDFMQAKGEYDIVVLDAPCTATGTIRKHPEILRQRTPEDVTEMAKKQKDMLEHACTLVKAGGKVLYANCSLSYEEGEGQMRKLPQNARLSAEQRVLPSEITENGGTGGFYYAIIDIS